MSKNKEPEFKRPNHPDFMTSSELCKIKFSGIRDHKIAMCYEIWMVGEMVKAVTYLEVAASEFALTTALLEYIGMMPSE